MVPTDMHIPSLFDVKGKVGTCVLSSSVVRSAERASWIAVVTGGGSGIGTMIAAAYVQNGAKVYIASRRLELLQKVAGEWGQKGWNVVPYVYSTS